MNKEDFIEKINRQRGWADVIDLYMLIHIYTDEFGILYTDLKIEDELIYMWEKINEVKVEKVISDTKKCSGCGVVKDMKCFYKKEKSDDGKTSRCSVCIREYMSKWNKKRKVEKVSFYN